MKDFIKKLVRENLNEVALNGDHPYERAEERVWGTSKMTNGKLNPDPPSINKAAWKNPDKFNKAVAMSASRGEIEIPATNEVREIFDTLRYVIDDLKVNVRLADDEIITLMLYGSKTVHRGGKIWGNVLTCIIEEQGNEGLMMTIQWQNTKDLATLRGDKYKSPKYVLNAPYLRRMNIKEVNDENVAELAMYPKPKKEKVAAEPKKEKFKKYKLPDGNVVRFYPQSNRFTDTNDKELDYDSTFAKFDDATQEKIFATIQEYSIR